MIDLTVKTLDSQNHAFSLSDEVRLLSLTYWGAVEGGGDGHRVFR